MFEIYRYVKTFVKLSKMAPRRPDTMSYIDTDTLEVRIHTSMWQIALYRMRIVHVRTTIGGIVIKY